MQPISMSTRGKKARRAVSPCASLLVWLCIAMLVVVTGGAPAFAQDISAATPQAEMQEAASVQQAPVAPEPTSDPVVQEPTAAPVVVEPTAVPPLAPTPTPISQEPSPTPTIELAPTVAPGIAASPTPTSEPAPSPTVAPTPATASRTTSLAVTSVSTGSGAITGCTEKGSDVLAPGGSLIVECFVAESGRLSADFTLGSLTGTVSGATTGWSAQLTAAGKSTGWVTGGATLSVSDHMPSFTIELRAPQTGGDPGAVVSVSLGVKVCNNGGNSCSNGSTTVSASLRPSFDSSRVTMTCDPNTVAITRLQQGASTCSIGVPVDAGSAVVSLNSVTISALPNGWSMTTSPQATVNADGTMTILPAVSLAAGESWSFSVTMSPGCGAGSTVELAVASSIAVAGSASAGPSAVIQIGATDAAGTLTAEVVGGLPEVGVEASFADQAASGALTYRVAAQGCGGWSVSVAAGPFFYEGPAPVGAPNALGLSLISAGAPTVVDGESGGVAAVADTGDLGTERTVLTAAPGGGSGTYEQELGVSVSVPAGAPVGTYRTTITITASSAP